MDSTNYFHSNKSITHSDNDFYNFISHVIKVKVLQKYFSALGIDYYAIKDDEPIRHIKKNASTNNSLF